MLIVFGSIYFHSLYTAKTLPGPNETVFADAHVLNPSGKGLCQSLAAARWGVKTALVSRVGEDPFAQKILARIRRQGVMTSGIVEDDLPSGAVVRISDEAGKTHTIVLQGANGSITADQVPEEIMRPENYVLVQTELSTKETGAVIEKAKAGGAKVILNLAPDLHMPTGVEKQIDYLIVNSPEARQLAEKLGIAADADNIRLAQAFSQMGPFTCVITDKAGSVVVTKEGQGWRVPALPVADVVDSSTAGDCYCGTFAACLHDGDTVVDSMRKASVASSLSCKAEDIFDAFPYKDEIRENLDDLDAVEKVEV